MRIVQLYSHLNGHEWLLIHRQSIWEEIQQTIALIDAEACRIKVSKESTMMGRLLYSPKEINRRFGAELRRYGWTENRTSYWVTDDANLIRQTLQLPLGEQKARIEAQLKTPIFSYNQTDFEKERVAIEVQFGKYAFIAYDLFVKHMAFYVGNKIDAGIEILPMKRMQSQLSSGPGYYEGALYDLVRQGRGVPAVPLVLLGIDA